MEYTQHHDGRHWFIEIGEGDDRITIFDNLTEEQCEIIVGMYAALKYHREAINNRDGLIAHRIAHNMIEQALSKAEEK